MAAKCKFSTLLSKARARDGEPPVLANIIRALRRGWLRMMAPFALVAAWQNTFFRSRPDTCDKPDFGVR